MSSHAIVLKVKSIDSIIVITSFSETILYEYPDAIFEITEAIEIKYSK